MLRRLRLALWILVGIAAIAGALIAIGVGRPDDPATPTTAQSLTEIGGPFTLTGTDGKPFTSARLAGKPYAIFFGFTHCPDVCPTTLARLARLRKQVGKGDDSFAILFVSVDPERDTPATVGEYVGLFGSPVIGLTGSPAMIDRVKKQHGIYSAKAADAGTGYSVDHTASVLLFDRDGNFLATIAPDEGDPAALAKLKRLAS